MSMMPSLPGALRLLPAVAALVAAGVAPAAAQRYAERVAVTAVEVPVQVVRGGEAVRGLTRDDFVLLDRGVEVELTDFEVLDVLAPASLAAPAAAASPPAVAAAAPEDEVGAGRHLLFLFDFQFSTRRRLKVAVDGARRLVETDLAPRDRVAVAMYTGSAGANILVGFTRDHAEIELGLSYLDALARRRSRDLRRAREELIAYWTRVSGDEGEASAASRFRALAERLGPSAALALSGLTLGGDVMSLAEYDAISGAGGDRGRGDGVGGGALGALVGPRLIDDGAVELEDVLSQLLAYGEAMADLATLLRDVPQPKQLMYFSEGFSTGVLTNAETQGRALSRLEPGIRALQAGGWAIQAIDVEGVPDSLAASGRSATAEVDPAATTFVTGNPRGAIRPQTGQAGFDAEALAYLAGETGGLLVENHNDVETAGERILAATAVTYLLVFQPRDLESDGGYHRLEVRLAEPIRGARVLHRPGYVAPAAGEESSETARRMDWARLVTGDETVTELAADSIVLSGPRARFVVEIPPGELSADDGAAAIELELQAYVFDRRDALGGHLERRLRLDPGRVGEPLRRGGLRLSGGLDLPYGRHRLRLVVRHLGSERVFARSHPVENPVDTRRWAQEPVLLEPAGQGLFLEVEPAGWGELGLSPERFIPVASPLIAPGGRRPIYFRFFVPAGSSARVEARVLDAAGAPVDGAAVSWPERLPDAGDGSTRLRGLFDAGSLAPGAYRLELAVDDGSAEAPMVVSRPFTVG